MEKPKKYPCAIADFTEMNSVYVQDLGKPAASFLAEVEQLAARDPSVPREKFLALAVAILARQTEDNTMDRHEGCSVEDETPNLDRPPLPPFGSDHRTAEDDNDGDARAYGGSARPGESTAHRLRSSLAGDRNSLVVDVGNNGDVLMTFGPADLEPAAQELRGVVACLRALAMSSEHINISPDAIIMLANVIGNHASYLSVMILKPKE